MHIHNAHCSQLHIIALPLFYVAAEWQHLFGGIVEVSYLLFCLERKYFPTFLIP